MVGFWRESESARERGKGREKAQAQAGRVAPASTCFLSLASLRVSSAFSLSLPPSISFWPKLLVLRGYPETFDPVSTRPLSLSKITNPRRGLLFFLSCASLYIIITSPSFHLYTHAYVYIYVYIHWYIVELAELIGAWFQAALPTTDAHKLE